MQEPFDILIGNVTYAVFPEEDTMYTIFKEGLEYLRIQKDGETGWLKLDAESDLPLFDEDTEVNEIGKQILLHKED